MSPFWWGVAAAYSLPFGLLLLAILITGLGRVTRRLRDVQAKVERLHEAIDKLPPAAGVPWDPRLRWTAQVGWSADGQPTRHYADPVDLLPPGA